MRFYLRIKAVVVSLVLVLVSSALKADGAEPPEGCLESKTKLKECLESGVINAEQFNEYLMVAEYNQQRAEKELKVAKYNLEHFFNKVPTRCDGDGMDRADVRGRNLWAAACIPHQSERTKSYLKALTDEWNEGRPLYITFMRLENGRYDRPKTADGKYEFIAPVGEDAEKKAAAHDCTPAIPENYRIGSVCGPTRF